MLLSQRVVHRSFFLIPFFFLMGKVYGSLSSFPFSIWLRNSVNYLGFWVFLFKGIKSLHRHHCFHLTTNLLKSVSYCLFKNGLNCLLLWLWCCNYYILLYYLWFKISLQLCGVDTIKNLLAPADFGFWVFW